MLTHRKPPQRLAKEVVTLRQRLWILTLGAAALVLWPALVRAYFVPVVPALPVAAAGTVVTPTPVGSVTTTVYGWRPGDAGLAAGNGYGAARGGGWTAPVGATGDGAAAPGATALPAGAALGATVVTDAPAGVTTTIFGWRPPLAAGSGSVTATGARATTGAAGSSVGNAPPAGGGSGAGPVAASLGAPGRLDVPGVAPTAADLQMIAWLNQARAAAGLPPMQVNYQLTQLAEMKAADMVRLGYFGHYSPTYGWPYQMEQAAGIRAPVLGAENIAIQPSIWMANGAFLASPEHRANIMNPNLNEVGVAVVPTGRGVVVVEEFVGTGPQ